MNGFSLLLRPSLWAAYIELLVTFQSKQIKFATMGFDLKVTQSFFDLTGSDMDALLNAKRSLCPEMKLSLYLAGFLSHNYLTRIGPFDFDRISELLKNPEWQKMGIKNFVKTKINYWNKEKYENEAKKGRPILILGWHHGAFLFSGSSIVKLVPDVIRPNEQPYPVQGNVCVVISPKPFERAVQMMEIISKNKPIFATFDSKYGKRETELEILGSRAYVSSNIMRFSRQFNLSVIPFTVYVNPNKDLDAYFGDNLFPDGKLDNLDDRDALKLAINYFTEDLKKRNVFAFNPKALSNLRYPNYATV